MNLKIKTVQMKFTNEEVKRIAEDLECGFTCYINTDTKEIRSIIDHQDYTVDEEYWKEDLDKLKAEWPRFIKIEPMNSNEGYQIMHNFAEQVSNTVLKEKLFNALNGRSVFRRFKNIVDNDFDLRDEWFAFKTKKYEEWVRDFFETEDDEENGV